MGMWGGGSGFGMSTTTGPFGMTSSSYDAGAAMQQRLAQEQWDWQKRLYEQQAKQSEQLGGSLSRLINQYNTAYGQAKAANEQRYKQLLDIADQTTGQREADIRSDYAGREADIIQQLARWGGSTVGSVLGLGVEREKQSALNRLADEMQGTKLGIIERREDEYPSSDVIVSLVNALGQGTGNADLFSALGNITLTGSGAPAIGSGGGGGPTRTTGAPRLGGVTRYGARA